MSDHLLSILESQIQNQEQLLREREQEIEQLRRQRDRLAELARQRDDLHAQLRAVEGDIALLERTMSSTLTKLGGRMDGMTGPPPASPRVPEPTPESPPTGAEPDEPKASLPDAIRKVLKASRQPVPAKEVVERVLAGGYESASKDFPNIVRAKLTQMADVENVRGQGYRLKGGK